MPSQTLCCKCSLCSAAVLLLVPDNMANTESNCWARPAGMKGQLQLRLCCRCSAAMLLGCYKGPLNCRLSRELWSLGTRGLEGGSSCMCFSQLCVVCAPLRRGCGCAGVPGSIANIVRSWKEGGAGRLRQEGGTAALRYPTLALDKKLVEVQQGRVLC